MINYRFFIVVSLLVCALAAGIDTVSSRSIADLYAKSTRELTAHYASAGRGVTMTPVGVYRAALDNEGIIRHDVQLVVVLAIVVIGHFLFFFFLFVHSIFPKIFPTMPSAASRDLPLRGLVNALYNTGKPGAVAAALLASCLFFFVRPQFEMSSSFTTLLVIISVSVALLLFLFYLNLQMTLLTLLPPLFAYICTLGTLKIIGHPLDIPALMLSVVIPCIGVVYSICFVRAHQRYRDINHPSYVLVRVAVFMAGVSTMLGCGVLTFAEHSLLKSIGITSLLGIGYLLLGSFLLLPTLLKVYMARETRRIGCSSTNDITGRTRDRFRTLEPYPRMFARFKLRFDPMFKDLPRMLFERKNVQTIIDVGCGYGVPACWCMEQYRDSEIYGIDPDPERVRVAAMAIGDRGRVNTGWAPDLPVVPRPADIVLLLDMLHYLDDGVLAAVFDSSFKALGNNGLLVTRFVLTPDRPSRSWRFEDGRIKLAGGRAWYRSAEQIAELMLRAKFVITINEVSAVNPELGWMVCRAEKMTAGGE